jgi:hypothetical protein
MIDSSSRSKQLLTRSLVASFIVGLCVASGITWLWLLSLAGMIPIVMGLPTRRSVRRYAITLLVVGLLASSIFLDLAWVVLAVIAAAIVVGVAGRWIPFAYPKEFVKYAAPGLVGLLGIIVLSILASSGLPLLAALLAPLFLAGILAWLWRNTKELYRQAPE